MLAVEIRHRDRDMAIAVAMRVRLGAAVIPGQLDLEIVLGIAQIDQREALEIEPVGGFQAECGVIELHRRVQVADADHAVDDFGHWLLPSLRRKA
jgi:hypothetical protein